LKRKILWNIVRIYEGDGREIIEALTDQRLGPLLSSVPDTWPKTPAIQKPFSADRELDQVVR